MRTTPAPLARTVGLPGAVLLGLGAMLGTGVFVGIAVAADIAGPLVVPAVLIAAALALCNALSSAQLAAAHPVSGGTYEYGYRLLSPFAGFTAGWLFLCAKSASAATAALGVAGYLTGGGGDVAWWGPAVAGGLVLGLTALVSLGLRRSNVVNAVLVGLTLASLGTFLVLNADGTAALPHAATDWPPLAEAAALAFVAFTGYGRLATLGEEVRDPARTIPRAVLLTLGVTTVLYVAVAAAVAGEATGGMPSADRLSAVRGDNPPMPNSLKEAEGMPPAASLRRLATANGPAWLPAVVTAGACTAMAGVLLNLLLGLSRVVLAMARRGDLPAGLAAVRGDSPRRAVWLAGAVVCGLTLIGSVRATWSLAAFTVLLYYALTNLAALRLPAEHRRYPRTVPLLGLLACVSLAWWVDLAAWATGSGVLAAGWAWFTVRRRPVGQAPA